MLPWCQADLGPALQVFYNLQSLPSILLEALGSVLVEAVEATKRAFDVQALERSESSMRLPLLSAFDTV